MPPDSNNSAQLLSKFMPSPPSKDIPNKTITLAEKSMNNFKPNYGSVPSSLKNSNKPASQGSDAASLISSSTHNKPARTELGETAPVTSLSSQRDVLFPISPAKAIQLYGKHLLDYEQG